MAAVTSIYNRELRAYFFTPLAYVFIAVFLLSLGAFTFEIGRFFDTNRADLSPFFFFHPWLYLVFLPAVTMRLWAEEIRSGTLELLLTLPAPVWALVVGKFLAAWTVAGVALLMTFPMWISVNYLGSPDNTAIMLAYIMSFMMAGGYVALSGALSALAGNQVVAFVLAVTIGFVFTVMGLPLVASGLAGFLGAGVAEAARSFSFLTHFEAAQRGVLELRALLFYAGFIVLWLTLNTLWISSRRAG
ncbi:ABC transporter permease subunit [Hirschia litorea]|uniref:ABC transporter permease subunit n=1 Tax=Hirschia litorea TaxID=1199156 RepID=A0ABW2IM31_9PROT